MTHNTIFRHEIHIEVMINKVLGVEWRQPITDILPASSIILMKFIESDDEIMKGTILLVNTVRWRLAEGVMLSYQYRLIISVSSAACVAIARCHPRSISPWLTKASLPNAEGIHLLVLWACCHDFYHADDKYLHKGAVCRYTSWRAVDNARYFPSAISSRRRAW